MAQQSGKSGGLVAVNQGTIQNCYTTVLQRRYEHLAGLCYENDGEIDRCYAAGRLLSRHKKSGLCAQQNGTLCESFWLRGHQVEEEQWTDWRSSHPHEHLSEDFLSSIGWDTAHTWHIAHGLPRLQQQTELHSSNWSDDQTIVEIQTAAELFACAEQVNRGEADAKTCFRLTRSIDLKGKAWTPIGEDTHCPFRACFDGNGFEIKNFTIDAKRFPYAGFFGIVAEGGAVLNLRLDCIVYGKGRVVGTLCAQNQGELLGCTVQGHHVVAGRLAGGLCGQNMGKIAYCCALGDLSLLVFALHWWVAAILLVLLFSGGTTVIALTAPPTAATEIFAPMIVDPNAKIVENETLPEPENPTDSNTSFSVVADMRVKAGEYTGLLNLRAPYWSKRGIVGSIYMPAGTLGLAEPALLYRSGLIAPGYGVEMVTLDTTALGGTLPVGVYEVNVELSFYDVVTNEKSAINSNLPMTLTVVE